MLCNRPHSKKIFLMDKMLENAFIHLLDLVDMKAVLLPKINSKMTKCV